MASRGVKSQRHLTTSISASQSSSQEAVGSGRAATATPLALLALLQLMVKATTENKRKEPPSPAHFCDTRSSDNEASYHPGDDISLQLAERFQYRETSPINHACWMGIRIKNGPLRSPHGQVSKHASILVGKLQAWIALACVDLTVHNTDDPFPGILVSNRTVRNGFQSMFIPCSCSFDQSRTCASLRTISTKYSAKLETNRIGYNC